MRQLQNTLLSDCFKAVHAHAPTFAAACVSQYVLLAPNLPPQTCSITTGNSELCHEGLDRRSGLIEQAGQARGYRSSRQDCPMPSLDSGCKINVSDGGSMRSNKADWCTLVHLHALAARPKASEIKPTLVKARGAGGGRRETRNCYLQLRVRFGMY